MAITTQYWTYQMLKDKVQRDLDLEEEEFIDDDEFLGYVNEAIDRAEQLVHTLYVDYFLTYDWITLAVGQEEYDYPDGVYGHKIRRLVYRNGSQVYTVHRLKDWKKFERYAIERINNQSSILDWFPLNRVPGQPKITFSPVPQEAGPFVQVWFLRMANRLEAPADILDIPEANNYVLQYVKMRCYEKEHNPMLKKALADLEVEKRELLGTLAAMTPDAENDIEQDFSSYEEHS